MAVQLPTPQQIRELADEMGLANKCHSRTMRKQAMKKTT